MSHLFTYSFATQTLSIAETLLSAGETVMNMRGTNSALLELVFCPDRLLTTNYTFEYCFRKCYKEKV